MKLKSNHIAGYISLHDVDELERNPDLGGEIIYRFKDPVAKHEPS
jgi:hypothetical protein